MIDKTSNVNHKIQLVGDNKALIVHRNRLKLCYGKSPWKTSLKPDRTFAEVVATPSVTRPAGYTSIDDIGQTSRPQRNRRPPDHYHP